MAEYWRQAGKNVDWGRGRPFDVAFYRLNFADINRLGCDTTCQEVPIGYTNEPAILRQVA